MEIRLIQIEGFTIQIEGLTLRMYDSAILDGRFFNPKIKNQQCRQISNSTMSCNFINLDVCRCFLQSKIAILATQPVNLAKLFFGV